MYELRKALRRSRDYSAQVAEARSNTRGKKLGTLIHQDGTVTVLFA